MNDLSERLRQAVDYLRRNGYARSNGEIAGAIHVSAPTFSMAMSGARVPNWDLLLDLCDAYPINFWWLRTGKGSMVKVDREAALLRRIEELERELEQHRE